MDEISSFFSFWRGFVRKLKTVICQYVVYRIRIKSQDFSQEAGAHFFCLLVDTRRKPTFDTLSIAVKI